MTDAAARMAALRAEMRAEGDEAIRKVVEGGQALARYAADAGTWSDESIPAGIRHELRRLAQSVEAYVATIQSLDKRRAP